jgi:phospholipid transport system substrate-binding protein
MKALRAIKAAVFCGHVLAVMLLINPAAVAQAPKSASPEEVVSRLHASLIKAMREGDKLGYQGRVELLTPIVKQTHNLDFIARTALGAHWSQLDAGQRRTFKEIFAKLSIGTYAGWFKDYDGERFELLEQQSMPRNQVMVRSRLLLPKDEPVSFDYMLREGEEGWRIVNILADGVSDLALKRVEYRAILERDGFSQLIEMLKNKIALTKED